ncbi:MAG: FtsQ-type POTRA domain-containing protein [Candidatus Omnitrophota bacterium]|nr:FtsQ-type POTRA domain-containing protein [Candidatus Omnitrophota bacterium]
MARRRKRGRRGGLLKAIESAFINLFALLRKLFPTVVTAVLLVGLLLGVREALYADNALAVDRVIIEPAGVLSAGQSKQLHTELLGENILMVDLTRVAKRLETDPLIRRARVTRQVPSTLKVEVETRGPVAYIRFTPQGRYGLIAEDGMILDVVLKKSAPLVAIDAFGTSLKQPRVGKRVRDSAYFEAVDFIKKYWKHSMAQTETITNIRIDHLGNIAVTLNGGPEVLLGPRPDERIEALEKIFSLLEGPGRNTIEYIDLQFDDVIVKRRRG